MLADMRRAARLTQWELAAKSGLSMRTVRRAEKCKVSQASIDRIHEALDQEYGSIPSIVRLVADREKPYRVHTGNPDDSRAANLSVERYEKSWVVWWPSKPWALYPDGYIRNTNDSENAFGYTCFTNALATACIAAENIRRLNSLSSIAERKKAGFLSGIIKATSKDFCLPLD